MSPLGRLSAPPAANRPGERLRRGLGPRPPQGVHPRTACLSPGGPPLRPRHSGVSMWLNSGVGPVEVARRARHECRLAEEVRRLRTEARDLLEAAAGQSDPAERDRFNRTVARMMKLAHDPLPGPRQALELLETRLTRSSGRPAVLVRPSQPRQREAYHRDETCGLISGEGRRLTHAGWVLVGTAESAGYRPCKRCQPTA